MNPVDLDLFRWLAAGETPAPWMLAFGLATSKYGAWPCAVLVGWAIWRYPADRGYVLAVLVACMAASTLAHAIADWLNFPRPFALNLSPSHAAHANRGALPSAHGTTMSLGAMLFWIRYPLRSIGFALAVVAMLTCWARVYLGIHFPSDMAAGFLLACVMAFIFEVTRRLLFVSGWTARQKARFRRHLGLQVFVR